MNRIRRPFTIVLTAGVSLLVFLSGYITALGGQDQTLTEVGLMILSNAQTAAVQASNALLTSVYLVQIHLPLIPQG